MSISIRKQLTMILVGLMAGVFVAHYLINTFFLKEYYFVQKQEVLKDSYRILNEQMDENGRISDDELQHFIEYCNINGVMFLVADRNYQMVLGMKDNAAIMIGRLNGYSFGIDRDVTILEQTERYTIQEKYDTALNLNYLEMWGMLDPGFYFILRINMEGISESVRIANEFMKWICLCGIIIAFAIGTMISNRVSRPIRELTELSKRMANLDFDVKYTSGGSNEVGQLGAHFNQMSERLEETYSKLLTANNELQNDLENREKMDVMRKEFLSNVSHELKTPIALIQGYAEGLQECINDDPESRDFYCEVIMDEASKMNGIVQKLLTLNQLEFGNDQVIMERFDIAELIQNKIQSVMILAQQKNAVIRYFGSEIQPVWGDEYKIEEVLTNYLSNALNHVDGEKNIEVRVKEKKEDSVVRVSVFNTGTEIPELDLERIWDKFYKVDKARTREYGGSGVGLSIVKAIMESFHQKYGVENRGNGVEFWFELKSGEGSAGTMDDKTKVE